MTRDEDKQGLTVSQSQPILASNGQPEDELTAAFRLLADAPWSDNPEPPKVDPETAAWARAMCIADGGKPDKVIGFPALPRWYSWVTIAGTAMKAAASLGYAAPEMAALGPSTKANSGRDQ